ncbi:MAG: hypothetical protein LCH77_16425 [Actinobacteria bacterium]|nr:hypothetical protein [Actinomycetota bacterium]
MPRLLTGLLGAAGGAVAAAAVTRALRRYPPGGAARWTRTNHAGRPISLLEGPGYVLGSAAGALAAAVVAGEARDAGPALLATTGAGLAGLLDDLAGDSSSKGLKGHLGALRRGQVTTGAIKIGAIGVTGFAAAALEDRRAGRDLGLSTLLGAGVIAGSANIGNLLDLRPGRAGKTTVLAGILPALRGEPAAAGAVGAALGVLPGDLAGATMLGDTGANAAGALIGSALVARTGVVGRFLTLALLAGLTLASERISFTAVIESTPGLRELDAWGRG